MRILLAVVFILVTAAAAAAQSARGVSLNIGAGSVGSTSRVVLGAVAQVTVGTDIQISRNWGLRVDAGRRLPSRRSWEPRSLYYERSPDDPSQVIETDTTQIATEDTLVDVAVLLRRAWPVGERFEAALLTGLDLSFVKFHHHITFRPHPASGRPEEVHEHTNRRTLVVVDAGIEGGACWYTGSRGCSPPMKSIDGRSSGLVSS
jgi:hypothetical protein